MDSVTQLVLGGVVGYAAMKDRVGRRALVYGALYGTLPDLDVLLPYSDPIKEFTFHRSFSHSLIIHALLAPLFAKLMTLFHGHHRRDFWRWTLTIFFIFSTHAVLDTFTVYGTQLLWPLTDYPFAISSVFIIDPLYTFPLLIACLAALVLKISETNRGKIAIGSLVLSSVYLGWSIISKLYVEHKIDQAFASRMINNVRYETIPAPFTTLLWRIVAVSDSGYYEGYVSVFDSVDEVSLYPQTSQYALLQTAPLPWHILRLQWFTKGFYSVTVKEDDVYISDLRMGIEGSYVFTFKVATLKDGALSPTVIQQVENKIDIDDLDKFFTRIWDPSVNLSYEARAKKSL